MEANAVMTHVDNILQTRFEGKSRPFLHCSDIGIVTPYRQQSNWIRKLCNGKGYEKIAVGTAELFQGQERSIIIISTVRTLGGSLGFVRDEKVSRNRNFNLSFEKINN